MTNQINSKTIADDQECYVDGGAPKDTLFCARNFMTRDTSYRWAQSAVAALVSLNPATARFLLDAPVLTMHYICLAIAALRARPQNAMPLVQLAACIAIRPRREVLSELYGCDLGGIDVLKRLSPHVMSETAYIQLAHMLGDPDLRTVLHRTTQINERKLIDLASATEEQVSHYGPLAIMATGVLPLAASTDTLRRLRPDIPEKTIIEALRKLSNHGDLQKLVASLLLPCSLPEPPWLGSDTLRPFTSVRELKRASRDFQNCLKDPGVWLDAVLGKTAYYISKGDGTQLIVSIERHRELPVWHIGDIRGVKNAIPSFHRLQLIEAQLTAAGFHPKEAHRINLFGFDHDDF